MHIAVALLFAGLAAASETPGVRIDADTSAAIFRVTGWKEAASLSPGQRAERFAVYIDRDVAGLPPLLGTYSLESGTLVFRSRFPLQPGQRYRAVLRADPAAAPLVAVFESPKLPSFPAGRVEHIYPSTDRWPENQLKFYIHFSSQMSRGEATRRVHLLGQDGREIELPFLEIDEELWDRDRKRLTIFFDPGRVKRGLVPHNEVGAPLEAGKRYTLVIDREWPDAQGQPLAQEHRKSVLVGAADRTPIAPKAWRLKLPRPGTAEPLTVDFGEPLDRALLDRMIGVLDPSGKPIDGSIAVERGETRWLFTPAAPWQPGDHRLVATNTLEDLAGNKISRVFDVDVFERVAERITAETTSLKFRVR